MFEIANNLKVYFIAYSLSMARLTVVFSVMPLMGEGVIPGVVRQVMLFGISMVLFPYMLEVIPRDQLNIEVLVPIYLKESLIGFVIGYLASMVFWIGDSIGFFVDNQRGASMAMAFDPMVGEQTSPLGMMIGKAVVALFVTIGGLLALLTVIFQSYLLWPAFSFTPDLHAYFPAEILAIFDDLIRQSLLYAAPVMMILFFSEFGLGLMNRFAPQLNVFFLSMPIKSGIAMFLFVIYAEFLLNFFKKEFLRFPRILEVVELLIQ